MSILPRITILFLLGLGGCRSFGPVRAETLTRLQPMPLAAALPERFELELAAPGLAGTFDGVFAVAERGFDLQLFPDIGGKVFDLHVGPGTIDAELPGSHYRAVAPLDEAKPHLALVLAAVFAELLAPVDARRVLGERLLAEGRSEVDLRPALGSGRVVATLAADGHVQAYSISLGWLAFDFMDTGALEGRGITAQFRFDGGA